MSSRKNKNRNKRPQQKNPVHQNSVDVLKAAVEETESDDAVVLVTPPVPESEPPKAPEIREELMKAVEAAAAEAEPAEEDVKTFEPSKNESAASDDEAEDETEEVRKFIPRRIQDDEDDSEESILSLGDIFGGEADEETTEASDTESVTAIKEVQRPNRLYLVFAIFVIIMSVIGIISTVNFTVNFVMDIANQTELKNELAVFLYPVVSVDPPDCDKVEELPSTIVLESAIWRIILRGENKNYERLYNTYMYVPAVDVEYSVRAIYGNSAKIEHQTVGSIDTTFTYVKDSNSYLVPVNPFYTAYTPYIRNVSSVGELYTVEVDYITPSALDIEGIEYENPPQKTMCYTLSKRANGMTLHSIKNITSKENMYE